MVELKHYKIKSIDFTNNVSNATELKLQNQFKYNVNYIGAENKCIGVLTFRVADTSLDSFEIKIEMLAEFTYDDSDDKADIHISSFDQIFPFLRQAIHNVTSVSGMPGLMIPIVKLKKDAVSVKNNKISEDEESPLN